MGVGPDHLPRVSDEAMFAAAESEAAVPMDGMAPLEVLFGWWWNKSRWILTYILISHYYTILHRLFGLCDGAILSRCRVIKAHPHADQA